MKRQGLRKAHRGWSWVPLLVGAALSPACSPDFAPFNRLTGLRVLGIQSDPPAPATGETATFRALVYTPPGFPEPQYEWSWCPFPGAAEEGYRCRVTQEQIAAMFPQQADQLPPLFIGTSPTVTLANVVDPAVLATFCAGVSGPIGNLVNCDNGFRVQVSLTVRTTGTDPTQTDRVDAVTTAYWRFDPATTPNANPEIEVLNVLLPGGGVEPITEVPAATSTPLPRDVETSLQAVVLPTAAEFYSGFDDDRNVAELQERLFMTWFVETGGTDDTRTSFSPTRPTDVTEDLRRFGNLQLNSWEPALKKDYSRDEARIHVVIHDNRGGVSWKSGTVNLVPTRE